MRKTYPEAPAALPCSPSAPPAGGEASAAAPFAAYPPAPAVPSPALSPFGAGDAGALWPCLSCRRLFTTSCMQSTMSWARFDLSFTSLVTFAAAAALPLPPPPAPDEEEGADDEELASSVTMTFISSSFSSHQPWMRSKGMCSCTSSPGTVSTVSPLGSTIIWFSCTSSPSSALGTITEKRRVAEVAIAALPTHTRPSPRIRGGRGVRERASERARASGSDAYGEDAPREASTQGGRGGSYP